MPSEKIIVKPSETPMLRVGIKWDGIEEDYPRFGVLKQIINAAQKALKVIIEKKPSHNLDLLCFCYDDNNALKKMTSSFSVIPKNPTKQDTSIVHSGDDNTGTGFGFDEELLLSLQNIDKEITKIVFAVWAEDTEFKKIKNGHFSVITTKNEATILTVPLSHTDQKQAFIAAKLQKTGDDWNVLKINDYTDIDTDAKSSLDDSIDDIIRNKYLT